MSFNEMVLTTERENNAFEELFEKCIMFAEASYNEYKTNLKEAELKVIQESGTPEDLIYLESKAKEGFIVRAGKTVSKMIQSFLEWLKKVINSIEEFLTGKSTKEALDKADKAVKKNPKLKSEKIEMKDVDKLEKSYSKHEAMIDKKLAMFKAKKFSANDNKDLEEIEKSYEKDLETAKKITTTITLATALAMGTVLLSKLKKQEKDLSNDKIPESQTTDSPEDMETYVNAYTIKLRINKDKANSLQTAIKDVFKGIKGKLTNSGEIEPEIGKAGEKGSKVEESVEITNIIDESSYLNELITEIEESAQINDDTEVQESTEFNAEEYLATLEATLINDKNDEGETVEVVESTEESNALEEYLEALEKEIDLINEGTDNTVVEESSDDDEVEFVSAESYLESMEAELFGESNDETESIEDYLISLEAELFGDESEAIEESAEERATRLEGILSEIESSIE